MKKAVRIVAALAAAVMLAVSCAGCAASSPVYASYGKYGITEAMYEYWLSYYKARFYASLSDYGLTDDGNGSVWDKSPDGGKTLGEQVKDHVDELIRQLLVSSVIYDERGFGEDAETKKLLDDAVDGFLSDEITAAGSRAELNRDLSQVGCNIDTLRRIFEFEARSMIVADRLFGEGGEYAVTDAEREEYYQSNYHRVKHVMINDSYKYVLDDKGSPKVDIYTGRYITEELTEGEAAEKRELAESVYRRASDGENFEDLIEEYNEDAGMEAYTEGYFVSPGSTVDPAYLSAAITMKTDEVRLQKTSYGLMIMKKYPLEPGMWQSEISYAFFTGMDTELLEQKKTSVYGKRYDGITYTDFSPDFSQLPMIRASQN